MNSLLIFTPKNTTRLNYVCRLVFVQHLGLWYKTTSNIDEFTAYNGPKISYDAKPVQDEIWINADGFLFENGIKAIPINTGLYINNTVPFFSNKGTFLFDMFAAIFYLISRYEEYLPFEKNQYGQFKATDSLACKLGFLQQPVVDYWIIDLKNKLSARYPALLFMQPVFNATYTYDIDVAYKYKGRSLFITAGNIVYDILRGKFKEVANRIKVLAGAKQDPFDTYAFIAAQQKKHKYDVIFFHLLGKKNKYNHNIPATQKTLQTLIQALNSQFTTGIHPSYYTDDDFELMNAEKKLLEKIISRPVNISRQHYLRLQLPLTFENLITTGITNDYTLGFAEMPGFRAGTSQSFPFYNLVKEAETNLVLHPAACMDVTFCDDLKMEPEHAITLIKQLIDAVKAVNGNFIFIWHNNTLSNLNGWKKMSVIHDEIGAYIKSVSF